MWSVHGSNNGRSDGSLPRNRKSDLGVSVGGLIVAVATKVRAQSWNLLVITRVGTYANNFTPSAW